MSNVNLIEVKCPNCNAQLKIGSDRQMFFCEYCGAQVFLDDGVARTEHTENININIKGRHDPVVVPRAVVVVESMCAFTLLDLMISNMSSQSEFISAFYKKN